MKQDWAEQYDTGIFLERADSQDFSQNCSLNSNNRTQLYSAYSRNLHVQLLIKLP